jgi:hypothetical protein
MYTCMYIYIHIICIHACTHSILILLADQNAPATYLCIHIHIEHTCIHAFYLYFFLETSTFSYVTPFLTTASLAPFLSEVLAPFVASSETLPHTVFFPKLKNAPSFAPDLWLFLAGEVGFTSFARTTEHKVRCDVHAAQNHAVVGTHLSGGLRQVMWYAAGHPRHRTKMCGRVFFPQTCSKMGVCVLL